MAEERDVPPTEENVGLNLTSAVARILMTPTSIVVRNETTTTDTEHKIERQRPSSPARQTPQLPPVLNETATSTTAATCSATNSIHTPPLNVIPVTAPPSMMPETQHTNDEESDIEIDINVVDDIDCQSPTDLSIDTSSELSPDSYEFSPLSYTTSGGYYKCRFCSFVTMTYTHLQLHMPKHGGLKALKCPMCDYTTNDKSNFRRHKRLHNRTNPATVLRCGKCEFTTVLPRKIREHYCQEHNEDYGHRMPPIASSTSIVLPAYQESHFNGGSHIDISQGHCSSTALGQGHCTVTGVSVGTSGLHSLLTTGQGHGIQFARANPIMPNCINQFTYETPDHRLHEDHNMASDYLRSIVSNIIPTPRVPATSTITSSSFYLPHVVESSQDLSPTTQKSFASARHYHTTDEDPQKIKFKSEPFDSDDVSDVSSSAIPLVIHSREIPRPMEAQTTQRLSIDIYDNSNIQQDHGNEALSSSNQNYVDNSRRKHTRASTCHNISIKCEMSHIGVQCSLPVIKREPVDNDNNRVDRNRSESILVNRGIQCEVLTTRRLTNRDSSDSERQSADNRCHHCGITFDDEVLFSIHLGCHSHTDPFVCNVCGKQCSNKYGFYSHIMRGHQC